MLDLLTADHTFVNERLALHYGIPNVRGDQFRRVTLTDPNRWGLLGKGGVLMATSYANRTAPVLRGAWILENIIGTPPAAPPPDVEGVQGKQGRREGHDSVREIMEQHRSKPSCNACHGVMDPLGFALENFDAIGEWRPQDRCAGTAIDASGKLVDGTPVNGPADLRQALVEAARAVRADDDREADDLRARPKRRVLRHAGGARDRPRRRARQLPVLVDRDGHRQERAVSDAQGARAPSSNVNAAARPRLDGEAEARAAIQR